VSFHLDFSDNHRAYLDGLPLSPEAKDRVDQFVEQHIANVSDQFRLDPENRPWTDKPYFVVRLILLDIWGDRGIHTIEIYVRDDKAKYGVLFIVFIDHH
jgi:hypothetical protein